MFGFESFLLRFLVAHGAFPSASGFPLLALSRLCIVPYHRPISRRRIHFDLILRQFRRSATLPPPMPERCARTWPYLVTKTLVLSSLTASEVRDGPVHDSRLCPRGGGCRLLRADMARCPKPRGRGPSGAKSTVCAGRGPRIPLVSTKHWRDSAPLWQGTMAIAPPATVCRIGSSGGQM